MKKYRCEVGHPATQDVAEGWEPCQSCIDERREHMTWLKYERTCGPKCVMGHPMRPGPIGLMICDECTEIALMQIRLKR